MVKVVANYLISEYQFSINYNKFDEKVLCVDLVQYICS